MRVGRVGIFLCCLILLAACSGCGRSYTKEYARLVEPYAVEVTFSGQLRQTVADGRVYRFEPGISKTRRAAFIRSQEKLCALLEEHGISADGMNFAVLRKHVNRAASDGLDAYFGLDTWKSYAQILTTLQTALGDYTNYGYLYALSDHLAAELGWVRDASGTVSPEVFAASPELLTLVYPCFAEAYTSPENIAACKALAREVLALMEDPFAGEDAFAQAVADYAAGQGIAYTPTYLEFAYHGTACPVKMRTEYLEVFWDSTYFASMPTSDVYYDTDVAFDLAGLIPFFEALDTELTAERERFGVSEERWIPVQMMEEIPYDYDSMDIEGLCDAWGDETYIYAETVYCLQHEYIHYLYHVASGGLYEEPYEPWMNEVLAYYFALDETFIDRLAYMKHDPYAPPSIWSIEEQIGQPFDSVEDEAAYERLVFAGMPEVKMQYELKTTNGAAALFGIYFTETWDEALLMRCMLFPDEMQELIGLTPEELVAHFCTWVEESA